jgi:hypothetical protein
VNPIPKNGEALITMRKRNSIPALPILVSFIGPLDSFTNTVLEADASKSYEWRLLSAMEVEIFVSTEVPFVDVLRQLADIAAVVPARIILTFLEGPEKIEGPRIECGEWRQVTDFKLFDWFPIAVGPHGWPDSVNIVRRLFSELGKSLPIPYDEAHDLVLKIALEKQ